MTITVYVPKPDTEIAALIDPRSGIVGRPVDHGQLVLDYEGNRFRAMNLVTLADRVCVAAGRALSNYPTSARCLASTDDVIAVADYWPEHGRITPAGGWELVQIAKWLDMWTGSRILPGLDREFFVSGARFVA